MGEHKEFICDGKTETCLNCPLPDCKRDERNERRKAQLKKRDRREYMRAYYQAHKETAKKEEREYYYAHKDEINKRSAERRVKKNAGKV